MNKMMLKLGAGTVSAALFMTLFSSSAFASTSLSVEGNGAGSDNSIVAKQKCTTELTQKSNTNVNFKVNAKSNTGSNSISNTTGDGDVNIDTGEATTTVGLVVTGGDNAATTPECCCADEDNDLTVDVKDNGAGTTNEVVTKKKSKLVTEQKSKTKVKAKVRGKAKTGNNSVVNTTGDGSVEVKTGDSTTEVVGEVTGGNNNL